MISTHPVSDLWGLFEQAHTTLEEPFIVYGDEAITLDRLRDKRSRLANHVIGARVALRIVDPVEYVQAVFLVSGKVESVVLMAADLPDDIAADILAKTRSAYLVESLEQILDDHGATASADHRHVDTEWLLTTSGTTGGPKIVKHSFDNLVRTVKPPRDDRPMITWGMMYDPSRLAGLQVVFQAAGGGGRMAMTDGSADFSRKVAQLVAAGCTHLSATPSIWRKILMSPQCSELNLRQITLGGEIADARILGALKAQFPTARITHIYASTELGVGFSVTDGIEGFPIDYLEGPVGSVELKVVEGVLWARLLRGATAGEAGHISLDDEGFICTGDRVAIQGGRVIFLGREATVVNVGGVKLQLEALEAKLRENDNVLDCRLSPIPNPIVGSLLVLLVVPAREVEDEIRFKHQLKLWCREVFPKAALPAKITIVDSIEVGSSGKVRRHLNEDSNCNGRI